MTSVRASCTPSAPIDKGHLTLVLRVGSDLRPIAGGFMGGAFFQKLYYEGQGRPVAVRFHRPGGFLVLLFAWWANSHLYRAPSAEVIPEFEDTHATAAARAATYTRPVPCRSYS